MVVLVMSTFAAASAPAVEDPSEAPLNCASPKAKSKLLTGFALQKDQNTDGALEAYGKCLEIEPACVSCLYEIGWSYWKLGEWQKVIGVWTEALKLNPKHARITQYLPTARENLKIVEAKNKVEVFRSKTTLMVDSVPKDAPVQISFVGRWQAYNPSPSSPLDHFDRDIDSPKSASFSPDGARVYVNSLEGSKTVVFDSIGLRKLGTIEHRFTGSEALFDAKPPFDYSLPPVKNRNSFQGKPVESVSSHGGRYLWIPYYRRSYDAHSSMISAMAVVDSESLTIKRVLSTGPIAKYVQVSPDGHYLAASHWGDNTVGLFDIRSTDPKDFAGIAKLVVDRALTKREMVGDRDKNCGFCLRGLAFSKDSRFLFVGRMRKGGIAIFDLLAKPVYLGTLYGLHAGPRDLQIDASGEYLYSGSNSSGFINKVRVAWILEQFKGKPPGSAIVVEEETSPVSKVFAGTGVRSIKLTPDGRYLFAAVNKASELQVFRTDEMKRVAEIPVDSFPVGLALSPDGKQAWVTSQGRDHRGGNSVGVYEIRYPLQDTISVSKDPRVVNPTTESVDKQQGQSAK